MGNGDVRGLKQAMFCLSVLVIPCYSDMNFGGAQELIWGANAVLFRILKNIVSFGLFGLFIWMMVDAFVHKNWAQKWLHIVGLAIFIILIQNANLLYRAFFVGQGVNKVYDGTGESG